MNPPHLVHLVDDDPAILNSIAGFLKARGFSVRTYGGPIEFLEAAGSGIGGCLVTDVCMPEMSGLDLITEIGERGFVLPTIFMTANADMALKLEVSKHDAVDVLEKPFKNGTLIKAIRKALAIQERGETEKSDSEILEARYSSLTAPEKELFRLLVQHRSNQLVARDLAIGVRELERRRATIMSKLHAATIADLVSFWSSIVSSSQLT
jgi:two-component system response regulator FixJ